MGILGLEIHVVNGENTLFKNALHQGWIIGFAAEVVFMQARSSLTKTTGGVALWNAAERGAGSVEQERCRPDGAFLVFLFGGYKHVAPLELFFS